MSPCSPVYSTWPFIPGANPGFLEVGFKSIKRGLVVNILPDVS